MNDSVPDSGLDDTIPLARLTVAAAGREAVPVEPLRKRLIPLALEREDASPLDTFIHETDVAALLAQWFGPDWRALCNNDLATLRALLDRDIAEIDDFLTDQVNAVLHHPTFQRLEASWRGLRFLMDQAGHAKDVAIRVLTVGWGELCRDFERAVEFDQSQFFQKVYAEEFGMPGGLPYGVLLCDYAIAHRTSPDRPAKDRGADDIAGLRGLSQVAAAAFAPAIIGGAPALFGLETFREFGLPQNLRAVFQQQEYDRWRGFQDSEDARFVGVVVPRVLMRAPYGDSAAARIGFRYREDDGGLALSDHCWGNGVYAYGSILIRAFLQSGWFADIRGARFDAPGGGRVEGLPVPGFATDAEGKAMKFSVEVAVSAALEKDLDDAGFIPLSRAKDTPYLVFYGNQSVQKAKAYESTAAAANARLSAMLRYMFCVARFAHYIKVQVRDQVGSYATAEACESALQSWLLGYCLGNDDASIEQKARYPLREAQVQVRDAPGKPGSFNCVIHLKPHFQLDQVYSSFRLVTELSQKGM